MVHIALLRGINVGGKNKLSMAKLKDVFLSLGYKNVDTYINSGNVIFSTDSSDGQKITNNIEKAIEADFNMQIQVIVRSIDNIRAIIRELPQDWVNDSTMKTDVIFLRDDIAEPSIVEQISSEPSIENVRYFAGTIFWNISRENTTKGSSVKLVKSELYKKMTVRNVNTVRRIATMMEAVV